MPSPTNGPCTRWYHAAAEVGHGGLGLLLDPVKNGGITQPRVALGQSCYESIIVSPTPFMGNNGEVFKLQDGSVWEVKYEYEYMYEYYPVVVVCPDRERMAISGRALHVARIGGEGDGKPPGAGPTPNVIESRISGEFTGWTGETIFRLDNGQIWQQASYSYHYRYHYRPAVLIIYIRGSYEMQVEGINQRIRVTRLR